MPYFDFSTASNSVLHDLILQTLNDCRLTPGCTKWWRSYLANRALHVCYCEALPASYEVLSGVPQGSVLGPNILTFSLSNCLVWSGIQTSNCLLMTSTFFVIWIPLWKNHLFGFDHKLCESSVTYTKGLKNLGLLIYSILHFHIMWITYLS